MIILYTNNMLNQTSTMGGDGGMPFTAKCPDGAHILQWYGASGDLLDRIGAKCSDGTILGPYGGLGGRAWSSSIDGPYTNFSGSAGNMIDRFDKYGGSGGKSWNDNCPSGVAIGIYGRSGDLVDNLGIKCGPLSKLCTKNLEDVECKGVDADILNKACSINFTPTCIARKDELTDNTMNKYCEANPYTDICSCYLPAPSFIPPDISGIAQCWNKKCVNYGYMSKNMKQSCPNITICEQDIKTSGNNTELTSNINVEKCSFITTAYNTITSKLGIGTPQGMNKTYIWIIGAILGAGILLLLMGSDKTPSKDVKKVDYNDRSTYNDRSNDRSTYQQYQQKV